MGMAACTHHEKEHFYKIMSALIMSGKSKPLILVIKLHNFLMAITLLNYISQQMF